MDLHIDLETVATVDLRRTGVYRYAEDANTDVIVAWLHCPQTGEWEEWRPGKDMPDLAMRAVIGGWTVHAFNVQFERAMWAAILGPRYGWLMPEEDCWDCTMARSMYWGWPGNLNMLGQAMGLPVQKDQDGHALMLRMCRPRSLNEDGTPVWWHNEDRVKYDRLSAYCRVDVQTEVFAAEQLPPLPPTERKLWLLDARMNAKGMPVDMTLADAMQAVATEAEAALRVDMKKATLGAVSGPSQTPALRTWLHAQGCPVPDLTKETVAATLRTLPPGAARDALILRRDGARASVSKLKAFREAVCADGTVKGMLRFYGAARTGRWSGAGGAKCQPHNLPRGSIKKPATAIDMMLAGHGAKAMELLFEASALGVVSSCLRGLFANG